MKIFFFIIILKGKILTKNQKDQSGLSLISLTWFEIIINRAMKLGLNQMFTSLNSEPFPTLSVNFHCLRSRKSGTMK